MIPARMRGGWTGAGALLLMLAARGPEAPPPVCDVAGKAPAADRALARTACQQARASYTGLFGVPAPPMRVYLSERPVLGGRLEQGWWALRWPTAAIIDTVGLKLGYARVGADRFESLERWAADHWEQFLPHEIGHLFLATEMRIPDRAPGWGGPRHGSREYGTPLPDWLDESVAMWMEPRAYRDARLARVMGAGQKPPPIAAVLGWTHPSGDSAVHGWKRTLTISSKVGRCRGVCAAVDTRTVRITATVDTLGRASADTTYLSPRDERAGAPGMADTFYAPALAALSYVHERGGAAAAGELLKRLRADPRRAPQLAGLPRIPRDSAALQADWEAWWSATTKRVPPRRAEQPPARPF